ncbi:hypothetical protein [Nocardia sp. AG03]|uniref:hypothetical protein n=1 Tax=Nocardia sp. AG03 TaxID=3025312 RepID=UPI0024186326|nr:hypothetical protein [Nocardia sp. AG03]
MRAKIMMAAAVALTGVLAACGAEQSSSTVAQPSSAPGITQPSGAPGTGSPDASVPGSPAPTVVPQDSAAPAPTVVPSDGSTSVDSRFTPVDPGRYQLDGSYYFQSPTGNIKCGILAAAPNGVGCQLAQTNHITPKLPNCTDAPNRKVAAHLYAGKSELLCTSQGIFVGIPQDGSPAGGVILNYGESLTIDGYTCTSSSQGVRCVAGAHGFAISADDQHTF